MAEPLPDPAPVPHRVLLVEDETVIRALLAEELRHAGLCVVEAGTADEALTYLQAGSLPDLLFSDIHMPGSMDGVALARLVVASYPSVKVVVTSGNPGPRNFADIGVFLPKPYRLDKASGLVLNILGLESPDD